MNASVSGTRAGPAGRGAFQSEQTGAPIVATAREQFSANGHSATTIESLATGAGVAIQTIYNPVGNQPALPAAALDAVSGPDAPATVPESLRERAARTAVFAGLVGVLAHWFAVAMPHSHGIFAAIRQAAAAETSAAALRDGRARARMERHMAAAAVRRRGGLGNGMSGADAAAVIFTIGHPDTYASLGVGFGRPLPGCRNWVYTSLLGALR